MNSRIRELRKLLGLSQEKFAGVIGLKQNAISIMEKPGSTVTEHNIRAICSQFNVREQWLRDGTGEVFEINDKKWNEFLDIFHELSPYLQDYLIKVAHGLLELQDKIRSDKCSKDC